MLTSRKIGYRQIGFLKPLVHDYLFSPEKVAEFFHLKPRIDSFATALDNRTNSDFDRNLLCKVLNKQYSGLTVLQKTKSNLELLQKENTFTVCCAHQNNLFTGPLYFIEKILSTIKLAEQLQKAYPDFNFVPVYWMGSEDHDFEELNHIHLFGKKLTWQTQQQGATGRMKLDARVEELTEEAAAILGNGEKQEELFFALEENYKAGRSWAAATFGFVNWLFSDFGLVIIDQDDRDLKKQFADLMKKEIGTSFCEKAVRTASEKLKATYKVQVNPRNLNLFYLGPNSRERIVRNELNGRLEVFSQNVTFSIDEAISQLDTHPENFSPNVVMRPLMQEMILPNLAFVGGGAEVAYWLQMKEMFAEAKVDFPVLVVRDHALMVTRGILKKLNQVGFSIEDFFKGEEEIVKQFMKAENHFSLEEEKKQLQELFETVAAKLSAVEPSLKKSALAVLANQRKAFDQLEGKVRTAQKRNAEIEINRLKTIKSAFFPNRVFQERMVNFMEFYSIWGDDWLNALYDSFDPLNSQLTILTEE